MSDTEIELVESCGNVFADLGLSNPDERMAKAELALAITRRIRGRGLNQSEAAALLQTSQAIVSAILRGRLSNFSYDRLLRFLNKLGCDVQIVVNPSADVDAPGTTTARVAA